MDEAGEKLKRAFTGAFALLFAVIVLCAVFCNQNVFGTQSPRSLLAGGLALAVGVLCAAWLLRLLPAPGKRLRRTLLAAFFTLCFLAQAHVGRALVVGATGDWDFGIVLRAALDFAADGAQGGIYFNNFPNNQPLMLLLAELFRLLRACGVTEEYELLVWGMRFGAVLLQLALFFLYLCAARLLGRRAGALALLLGAATAPFLLYAPVYYTDTVTAPIPIAILYCWLRLRAARREGRPGRGPLAAVFVLGVLGTLLKVTVVIMVIAVVLDWMISFPKRWERLAALALLAAVVAGVLIIVSAIVTGIISNLRKHIIAKTIFSVNGVSGLVFYVSLIALLLPMLGMELPFVGSVPYLILCIAVPFFLMYFAEPLSALCAGEKPEGSVGDILLNGFFEMFDTVLSFASNTMSFLRVGGFVLVHAGMMTVVFTLANMTGGVFYVLIVAVGNVFVMALEALFVGIQVLRLEFYEIFSRFFDANGVPFAPLRISLDPAADKAE